MRCHELCQIECQKRCQIKCHEICQIECQKICQIEFQNINPALQPNSIPESSTYVFFQTLCQNPVFSVPRNFSGPTLKFRTWPFWGINGNGNHWVQTCETNIWGIFKPLALIHGSEYSIFQKVCQNRCQIGCQKECQIESQKRM